MGGTRETTTTYETSPTPRNQRSKRNLKSYSPTRMADKSTAGIGLLEAEFFLAIGLLALLMFSNSSAQYSDKIMSFMKRGSLTCLLFFILALIASAGENAARIAKAFGALVIVAIALTSPVNTVISDVDALIKNDWTGTSETGNDTSGSSTASADTGTSSGTSSAVSNATSTLGNTATTEFESWFMHLSGPAQSAVSSAVKSVLSKLGL